MNVGSTSVSQPTCFAGQHLDLDATQPPPDAQAIVCATAKMAAQAVGNAAVGSGAVGTASVPAAPVPTAFLRFCLAICPPRCMLFTYPGGVIRHRCLAVCCFPFFFRLAATVALPRPLRGHFCRWNEGLLCVGIFSVFYFCSWPVRCRCTRRRKRATPIAVWFLHWWG